MVREIKLEKPYKSLLVKYGTDREENKPSVICIRAKAKITPREDKENYTEDIVTIKEKFTEYIRKVINRGNFHPSCLINVEIAENSVSFNKISNVRYDIYFKPTEKKTLIGYKPYITKISQRLDNKMIKLFDKYGLELL